MTFDASITVYYRVYDKTTRSDVWHRKTIYGVSWYGGQTVTVGDRGLNAADTYTVRIPRSALPTGYATPSEYARAENAKDLWTVQTGDVVAFGARDDDIQKAGDVNGPAFTVTGVFDNRRGVTNLKHIRIEGK